MPRRTNIYIGAGKTLVNGGRADVVESEDGARLYDPILAQINIADIHTKVACHVAGFAEFAHLANHGQFISDLVNECAWVRTTRLDVLLSGSKTKPDAWAIQVLACGVVAVLKRYQFKPTISEYENGTAIIRSLYLRLLDGLIKCAGFISPRDIKGLALRSRRIVRFPNGDK
jgi:hypothetical protein